MSQGFFSQFDDIWMLDGVRTPLVDYCGAFGHISPTDLGIKAARAALARAGVPGEHIGSVIAGNMAPGDFEQFMLPRHIGLYAGVPVEVPALMAQRICGTGFELFRQAGEQIQSGACEAVLVAGSENMTRNPIASFEHRNGFKLGGEDIAVAHTVTRSIAFGNGKNGFTWNSNPGAIRMFHNLAWDNAQGNYKFDLPGPVFLDNAAYREWVFRVWQARCTDMESTALAQVAWANRKPILIVRGLSDLAGAQKGTNPIDANEAGVSEIAARVLRQIVEEL